ncbi:hypothetical protein GTP46_28130 [Duganella sp. FT135W]|uniref:DUF2384 domain-containing protein n=1 Tax=Duganella flavida TaxID=2692175 RepID=A0A6L8KGI0_9BURK|nr:hypothetical protein [Duganella flavida]MYM26499.1 hypothetical protein [Duganella flavida]
MKDYSKLVPVFESDFYRLITFIRDANGILSPESFALVFESDVSPFGNATNVALERIYNASEDKAVQMYLSCLKITLAATDVSDSVERAVDWVKNEPIAHLDCKTGLALAAEGRTSEVLHYISSLYAGFCG